MKAFLFGFLVLGNTASSLAAKPFHFGCTTDLNPRQIIHFTVSLPSEAVNCTALAMDARGGAVGGNEGHMFNSDWSCEINELTKTQWLIRFKLIDARGQGPLDNRFKAVNVIVLSASGVGGGIAQTQNDQDLPVTCFSEQGPPPILFPVKNKE